MSYPAISVVKVAMKSFHDICAKHVHDAVLQAIDAISQFEILSKSRDVTLDKVIPGSNNVTSEIVQTKKGSFSQHKDFTFEMERTSEAQFATTVEARSAEEAIALTLQLLKQNIVLIPTRQASGDCRMISLCISYAIEIVDLDEPNQTTVGKPSIEFVTTENQLQSHGQEFTANFDASLHAWRVAIVKAFHLNPIEEAFVLDLPFKHPGDSPAKRIAAVLAIRT